MKHKGKPDKNNLLLLVLLFWIGLGEFGMADRILTREVDWNAPAGGRIKEVRFRIQEEAGQAEATAAAAALSQTAAVNVIDSPPIDGFVPWIAITTTNKRLSEVETDAVPESSITGQFTAADPQSDFVVGVFDTGASAHVMNYAGAEELLLNNETYLTNNEIIISGVTGAVSAWVSYPLGVFIGGLNLLDPEAKLTDTTGMVGESNVSILVGQDPGSNPDLVGAIGTPMSVFFTASIRNDQPVTAVHQTKEYTGPSIYLFEADDETAPHYSHRVPLELRPLGASAVQYISYDFEELFTPTSPSVILGTGAQSLFFVHSVDLKEGSYSAIDKSRFMLDTGAQITVIGDRVAARLGLDPEAWEFEVPIMGVTGESIDAPGYYIDSIQIPAVGQWLEYTNVPVVWLEISSPEGGKLDGVIGMNLFTEYNLILRGGGLFLGEDPVLEFQRIAPALPGDLAPDPRDGRVDLLDFDVFGTAWLSQTGQTGWNADADLAASGQIDLADLAVLAEHWLTFSLP